MQHLIILNFKWTSTFKLPALHLMGLGTASGSKHLYDICIVFWRLHVLCKQNTKIWNITFCSRVLPDKDAMLTEALETAATIASKSPVAVQGTKISLLYSRDHSVPDSLQQAVRICCSCLPMYLHSGSPYPVTACVCLFTQKWKIAELLCKDSHGNVMFNAILWQKSLSYIMLLIRQDYAASKSSPTIFTILKGFWCSALMLFCCMTVCWPLTPPFYCLVSFWLPRECSTEGQKNNKNNTMQLVNVTYEEWLSG